MPVDDEVIYSGMSPTICEYMEIGAEVGASVVSVDQMLNMMQRRDFRRNRLVNEMVRLANSLADYMEDREGWHGMERAERARASD